jgi:hypothetical protein
MGEHAANLCTEFCRLAGMGDDPGDVPQADWILDALNTSDLGQLFGVPVVEDWVGS